MFLEHHFYLVAALACLYVSYIMLKNTAITLAEGEFWGYTFSGLLTAACVVAFVIFAIHAYGEFL